MCQSCRFGRYDDRKCCDECRSNEKSHVIIYEDIYIRRLISYAKCALSHIAVGNAGKCLVYVE